MRSIGLLVIVFVKAAILILYANLQDTLMNDIDGEYRFLIYLIACGGSLLALGLTWERTNIIELHWLSRWLIIPSIILIPFALVSLYFSFGSIERFIRPFQDVPGLIAVFISELVSHFSGNFQTLK
jgi:hypothetical protein